MRKIQNGYAICSECKQEYDVLEAKELYDEEFEGHYEYSDFGVNMCASCAISFTYDCELSYEKYLDGKLKI